MEQLRGLLTRNTLLELQTIKRDISNNKFRPDGYYRAIEDIKTDIKYLKHKQKHFRNGITNA